MRPPVLNIEVNLGTNPFFTISLFYSSPEAIGKATTANSQEREPSNVIFGMKSNPSPAAWEIDQPGIPLDESGPYMSSATPADPTSNLKSAPELTSGKQHRGKKSAHLAKGTEVNRSRQRLPAYPGLNRWLLLEKVGQGAFSTVYRARDTENEHGEVAIKVLRKFEMDKQQLSNLQKEIQIMRRLDHSNTTQLIETFESKQFCFIIMEFCPGGELFNQVVKLTYLSEDLSRHVILQVAEAVKYLHLTLGVVHRDIKPENILFFPIPMEPSKNPKPTLPGEEGKLDEGDFVPGVGSGGIGTVKLADYGLSKIIEGDSTMTPCGTVGYAAPETMGDQGYMSGVDMWAIGCVLYTLLVGFPPFYDPDLRTMIKNVSCGKFEFGLPWWENISSDAKDLIKNLLTVDPVKRFTIEEFLSHPWITNQPEGDLAQENPIARPSVHLQPLSANQTDAQPPVLATEAHIEARTPDAMNVREIFDVAFSVHQQQATDQAGLENPKVSRPKSTKGQSDMIFPMDPMTPEGHQTGANTSFTACFSKKEAPQKLDLSKSTLLEKRKSRERSLSLSNT